MIKTYKRAIADLERILNSWSMFSISGLKSIKKDTIELLSNVADRIPNEYDRQPMERALLVMSSIRFPHYFHKNCNESIRNVLRTSISIFHELIRRRGLGK